MIFLIVLFASINFPDDNIVWKYQKAGQASVIPRNVSFKYVQ